MNRSQERRQGKATTPGDDASAKDRQFETDAFRGVVMALMALTALTALVATHPLIELGARRSRRADRLRLVGSQGGGEIVWSDRDRRDAGPPRAAPRGRPPEILATIGLAKLSIAASGARS